MEGTKRKQQEAGIPDPHLQDWWHRYKQCCSCSQWKLLSDGETHSITTAGPQEKNPFGFNYVLQWHCHGCWQWKQTKGKEAKKDKDADKDEDKDDKDEEDGPSKQKKPVGTLQPWEDPMEVDC